MTDAIRRAGALALFGGGLWVLVGTTPVLAQSCVGDCDGSNNVVINELVICVNIALGNSPVSACESCDSNGDGTVIVNELILAVNNALNGCNATPPTAGATPTATPTGEPCPLEEGRYTITQGAGGTLRVASFSTFAFPEGGTLVLEVAPAFQPECVHDVVIPAEIGFRAPTFCIPALGFSVSVTQRGCGIGRIDSNGGSDFTVVELGDTSDTNGPCDLPQASCPRTGPAPDSSIRVQINVGDGTPDSCPGGGSANALVAVPVFTRTWLEASEGAICPGMTFDPPTDALIVEFPQTLDFTTDTTRSQFQDLDGDGCFISGAGPAQGHPMLTGRCMDLEARTVTTVASGVIGSRGAPLYDLAFSTFLPNTYPPPEPRQGAQCADPPVINFMGSADRCIQ